MNLIAILLCCLANHVRSQTNDGKVFLPARILAQQKTISKNSDLYLTCSTFGKGQSQVFVYLCNNDIKVERKSQKQDQYDTTFTIYKVALHNSGNYSCVYSLREESVSRVTGKGHNTIQILVIDNFLPAVISITEPSTVAEGADVEFRCTVSKPLQTLGECQLIQSYLQRNDTILQVRPFNVAQKKATFTIEGAVRRDSGHYSCVVLPSKCIQKHEDMVYGENTVVLKVTEEYFLHLGIFGGVLILVILMGLCMFWIWKQGLLTDCCNSSECQKAESDMSEEQQEQGQAEDGDLETPDGESSSFEEEEDYQNGMVPVDDESSYNSDIEGLYSVADELTSISAPVPMYARSIKRKTHRL